MLTLGLSSFRHDTAAALFEDGVIKAAIENDKLLRFPSMGAPEEAIRFCLEKAGASWNDLDAIAIEAEGVHGPTGHSRRAGSRVISPGLAPYRGSNGLGFFARELAQLQKSALDQDVPSKLFRFEHHLCHAASAFYLSPFDRALILTMDEEGDGNSGMVAVGEGTQIRVLRKIRFPHSLAWVYSQVTRLLGFVPRKEEHKTQWLSLGGEPVLKNVFLEMCRSGHNHLPSLDSRFVDPGNGSTFSRRFYQELSLGEGTTPLQDDQRLAVASSLQHACAEIVGSLLEYFRVREGVQKVCLAGGLFQNTLLVASWKSNWAPMKFLFHLRQAILDARWAVAYWFGIN